MRKSKENIKEKIINCLLYKKGDGFVSTNIIAENIGSNFPTTKKFIEQLDKSILEKTIVDGRVLGWRLNLDLLTLLSETKFSELCFPITINKNRKDKK